jgi:CubicO group peptidase (beta-lactamase class C family)
MTGSPEPRSRPTRADWLSAPMNRWSFRNVRSLFPTDRVSAARRGPLPQDIDSAIIDDTVAEYLERSFTDAFVVLHDGVLKAEYYAPGVKVDERHIMFSVTKSVVGVVAGFLIEEGLLDENAPVSTYVPEARAGGYSSATIRQLLDMTADIDFTEDYDGPDMRRYRAAIGMGVEADGEGIHRFVTGLPGAGCHGKAFKYVSPTTELTGWACERATGMSFAELISRHVWIPIGAEHDADLMLDRLGGSRVSGGFCATARDMARFGHLLIEPGEGPRARAIGSLMERGDPETWLAGNLTDFLPNGLYRSFWYQLADQPDVYLGAGIYGQRLYVDVRHRVVIVQQSSLPDVLDEAAWRDSFAVFRDVVRDASKHLTA